MTQIMPYSPKFVYGPGPTTINMKHSSGLMDPDHEYVGGGTESGAGVPETYVIRKVNTLAFVLRVDQTEWTTILTMLDWIIESGSLGQFDFYPDQLKAEHYTCWLVKPKSGDKLDTRRLQTYAYAYEIPMIIRTVNGTPFNNLLA